MGGEDSVSDDRNESGCREMDNGGSEGKIGGGGGGRWLLEGEYNEKASAESFQAALKEWRGSMETQETCTITGITFFNSGTLSIYIPITDLCMIDLCMCIFKNYMHNKIILNKHKVVPAFVSQYSNCDVKLQSLHSITKGNY